MLRAQYDHIHTFFLLIRKYIVYIGATHLRARECAFDAICVFYSYNESETIVD